jgi:hypothetical protein
MLTIFSIPRAFEGQTRVIQYNAIGSWIRLHNHYDVTLLGDELGVADAAAELGVRHEPTIARNEFGTPVISDVFTRMNALTDHSFVAFVNADIILLDDFVPALEAVAQLDGQFMLVSSRFNYWLDVPLKYTPGWQTNLRQRARAEKRMYPAGGSDIFVSRRGLLGLIPPFAIGRGYWDNWLMREAHRLGAELIDLTEAVTTVHQMHTYRDVAGLTGENSIDTAVYQGPEGRRNLQLAGGRSKLFTVFDAPSIMKPDHRLVSTWWPRLIHRRTKAWLRRHFQERFRM